MTIDLATLLLVPLLVLPIVMLLRYVGCSSFGADDSPPKSPPPYQDLVLGKVTTAEQTQQLKHPSSLVSPADVVGYWRLLDAVGSTTARDEAGFQDGTYVTGNPISGVPSGAGVDGSDSAPGTIEASGVSSLIARDTAGTARVFNGGYVRIDDKPGLHPPEFTLLAWVQTTTAQNGNEHVIVADGADFRRPPTLDGDSTGWTLFLNGQGVVQVTLRPVEQWTTIAVDGQTVPVSGGPRTVRYGKAGGPYEVNTAVSGSLYCWPTSFGNVDPSPGVLKNCDLLSPGGGVAGFASSALLPLGGKQFIALTGRDLGGGTLLLTLFVNGKFVNKATAASWTRASGVPVLIGVRNGAAGAAVPVAPTRPFLGQIQDVALYRTALDQQVIENLYAIGVAT